ncbi:MAG TPA: hypothetical protein VF384_16665 [Planctomycetota bacterium]
MKGPDEHPTPAELATWLAEERIDDSYAVFVRMHADADDATWRWCCGSSCDPCVQRLGRVVDRVRAARAARAARDDSR